MSKNTGGPAFPEHIAVTEVGDTYSGEPGMSLRDYFAAHVQVDYVMVSKILDAQGKHQATADEISKMEAILRYNKADAMLAERAK